MKLALLWIVQLISTLAGCEKSCAQHSKSDITLLGVSIEDGNGTVEGYHVYVGDSEHKFGREIYQYVTFAELPALIKRMLDVYQIQRLNSDESFREFSDSECDESLNYNCDSINT